MQNSQGNYNNGNNNNRRRRKNPRNTQNMQTHRVRRTQSPDWDYSNYSDINMSGFSNNMPPAQKSNVNRRRIKAVPKNSKKKKNVIILAASKLLKRTNTIELVRYGEGVDRIFLIVVIILLSFGTVMVFSASYANALWRYGDTYHFAKKQLLMASIGIIAMIVTSYLADYRFIKKVAVLFFIGVLALNYVTPFFGKILNGTPRWFVLFGIQFQPSELLKIAVVFMFAYYINKMGDKMKTFLWGIVMPVTIILIIAGAMFFQSHFSGLIIIAALCLLMIFIGESSVFWLGGFAAAGAAVLGYIIAFTPYASSRIQSWRDPFNEAFQNDESYQIIQSLYAIGSGGLLGVGIGQSKQKYLYLPEPQNDFIFSIVCEEVGFIGALIIIFLFVILIWRGFVIAYHAPDKFASLVVMGITLKVAIQFILNIAVVTNSVPNTGISLPFFSYGGTALIILLVEMGIILSVSRYSYQEKA